MDAKKERNNCVTLLQAAVQVASATRERLRQRGNEAEILLTAAQRSEAQLSTVRSTTVRLVAQRDHKRHDLCKVAAAVAVQNAKREQMRLKLSRLTLMHNQAEASSIALKKACERNAKLRNERAILLIERNQEVYLLQVSCPDLGAFWFKTFLFTRTWSFAKPRKVLYPSLGYNTEPCE